MKKLFLLFSVFLSISAAIPADALEWYLGGKLGFEWSLSADYSDANSAAKMPPALFGTGPGRDGHQIGSYGDFGRFLSVEAVAGIQILPWLRSELAVAYRPDMQYRGQANFRGVPGEQPVSASADSLSGMANIFLDIASLFGVNLGVFQPYMGGGAGITHNRLSEMTYDFPNNPGAHKVTITPSGEKTDIAFMASIGTGIALTDSIILDISYRYTDLGQVHTDAGKAYLNNIPGGIDIAETWAPLRTHGVFVGARYLFPQE
ncbi:MAG: porin family protein [Deltaproteobacteria bacterium]|nr:porin family protein [Deltaproteobacteria bacterium]